MKRRCPHCFQPTLGLGGIWLAEHRNKPVRCSSCGYDVRSRAGRSAVGIAAVLIGGLIASPPALFLLFLVSARHVGLKAAIALVLATIILMFAAASASTMVAPLYAWDPKISQERKSVWFVFARVVCSVLIVGIFALAIIAALRLLTA